MQHLQALSQPIQDLMPNILPANAPADLWHWRAWYRDGSVLNEYDAAGKHGFKEINLQEVVAFELVPQYNGYAAIHVRIDKPGMEPVFFRRRTIPISIDGQQLPGMPQMAQTTIHILGWKRSINGQEIGSYTFLYEDGSILVSDDFQAA